LLANGAGKVFSSVFGSESSDSSSGDEDDDDDEDSDAVSTSGIANLIRFSMN
jgi:hypothetical protein